MTIANRARSYITNGRLHYGYSGCPAPVRDPEIFRIRTHSLPAAIYRHRLRQVVGSGMRKEYTVPRL